MSGIGAADRRWLKQAVELGRNGRFGVSPNPLVGCILVRGEQQIGAGWHHKYGGDHAEVAALRDCQSLHGDKAAAMLREATAYVSLEPCVHQGKTPPCTDALIQAGIRRVVCALADPNLQVAGKGIARLRQQNIAVECEPIAALRQLAMLDNRGYLSVQRRQRPWLTLKLAASLDGRTALKDGSSQWITGTAARADVQAQRACADVVLTGSGTVLADNPRLLPRPEEMAEDDRAHWDEASLPPLRLVMDSQLRTPADAALFSLPGPIALACLEQADAAAAPKAAELIPLPADAQGKPSLAALMSLLHRRGCARVLAECGPALAGAMMQAELVDEILLYQSGKALGSDGLPLWSFAGPEQLPEAEYQLADSRPLGGDIRLRWHRKKSLAQIGYT